MLTIILSAVLFLITLAFIVSVIYFPKTLTILIPLIFALIFGVMTLFPNYEGYAVDSNFIPLGSEASVLFVVEGKNWIYLTLEFPNAKEPRLVKIVNTPNNKKQAEQAQEKAKKGLSIIRFDKNVNSENSNQQNNNGNGSDQSGQPGSGGIYGSANQQDIPGVSIKSIDVNESNTYQKTEN